MGTVEPYWQRLKRLRDDAGLSQPALYRKVEDVSFDMIRAFERPYEDQRNGRKSRARYPSADMLERIAEGLGVEPEEFPEYRLAKARELLDERHVGLEEAITHLEQISAALRKSAGQRPAKTAEQRAERHRKLQAIPDEAQTPEGGA